MTLITFIIPTIGRKSLPNALQSLINLNQPNWKAIVIFDGVSNNLENPEKYLPDKFLFFKIKKQGIEDIKNNSGKVRNFGFQTIIKKNINTEYIGFLDDDDTVHPKYIDYLQEEININPINDVCIFRMMYPNGYFLPNMYHTKIKVKQFGISFAFKKELLNNDNFQNFNNHPYEDFIFLKTLEEKKYKIIISPYISYFVRTNYEKCYSSYLENMHSLLPRVAINF